MSDGPHKSLPMRRAWRRLAEYADNRNFERDCRGEVGCSFLDERSARFTVQERHARSGSSAVEGRRRSRAHNSRLRDPVRPTRRRGAGAGREGADRALDEMPTTNSFERSIGIGSLNYTPTPIALARGRVHCSPG